ncbi:MAG: hypothetical protein GC185_09625 [Alphaproteobacteria bacterium]|nr:hypothetical protein [Alphaproteobacteria bacterium]
MKSCWIISEGLAGTEGQCLGVAEALGVEPVVKRIGLKFPWKQLTPMLLAGHDKALTPDSDPIQAPWPDLVIASGRKTIGISLLIKKLSGGRSFTVQLQDPRIDPKHFDFVVLPQHDPTRGPNVMVTQAGLHRVTPEKLAEAKRKFAKRFADIPRPRVAVLIGGSSKAHTMTRENARTLAQQLMHLAELPNTGLLITASRRTGAENTQLLREALQGPGIFFWDGAGENPYFGLLAHADYIIVTEDSVSMASEALSTGKPVYIAALEGGARRLDMFHRLLQEQGYTRPFTGLLEDWTYTPPDDTSRVAQEIRTRYAAHAAATADAGGKKPGKDTKKKKAQETKTGKKPRKTKGN